MNEPIISGWTIYWITRLDVLGAVAMNAAILAIVAICLTFLANFLMLPLLAEEEKLAAAFGGARTFAVKRLLPAALAATLLYAMLPTTRQAAAILVIPAVANSERVQGLGEGLVEAAEAWLQELKPEDPK